MLAMIHVNYVRKKTKCHHDQNCTYHLSVVSIINQPNLLTSSCVRNSFHEALEFTESKNNTSIYWKLRPFPFFPKTS